MTDRLFMIMNFSMHFGIYLKVEHFLIQKDAFYSQMLQKNASFLCTLLPLNEMTI